MARVELPRDHAPVIPPLEPAFSATLGNTVELRGQAADVGGLHGAMLARPAGRDCRLPGAAVADMRGQRRMQDLDGLQPEGFDAVEDPLA